MTHSGSFEFPFALALRDLLFPDRSLTKNAHDLPADELLRLAETSPHLLPDLGFHLDETAAGRRWVRGHLEFWETPN